MVTISDPLRYLVVYDYRLNKIVTLCRYQICNTINDVQFLEKGIVWGDAAGNIGVVEF